MSEKTKKLWEKIDSMPSGDRNPFETPFGPTNECLTSGQVVSFVENRETDSKIIRHIKHCKPCSMRILRFKNIYSSK